MTKQTIFQFIQERLKPKPITEEELKQLELKARKLRLLADIEQSKAIIKKAKADSWKGFTI